MCVYIVHTIQLWLVLFGTWKMFQNVACCRVGVVTFLLNLFLLSHSHLMPCNWPMMAFSCWIEKPEKVEWGRGLQIVTEFLWACPHFPQKTAKRVTSFIYQSEREPSNNFFLYMLNATCSTYNIFCENVRGYGFGKTYLKREINKQGLE